RQQLDAIQIRAAGPSYYKEKDLLEIKIKVPPKNEQIINTLESNKFYSLDYIQSIARTARLHDHQGILKIIESTDSKAIHEKEIISSIKHRISQYVSPVSSDLQNLNMYFIRKSEDESSVSLTDKISG